MQRKGEFARLAKEFGGGEHTPSASGDADESAEVDDPDAPEVLDVSKAKEKVKLSYDLEKVAGREGSRDA
jgi:hypothetical protein